MAATEKRSMWLYSGPAPEVETRKIAATQGIYMPGAVCALTSAGTIKIAHTSDSANDNVYGLLLEGVAAQLAANTEVKVAKFHEDQQWCIYVETGGADTTVAQSNVGNKYGITVVAVGGTAGQIGYATLKLDSGTTNVCMIVRDIMSNVEGSKFTTSDSPGVAIVSVLANNIQAVHA